MSIPHPAPISASSFSAVELLPDNGSVLLLDQRLLPHEETYLRLSSVDEMATAIVDMAVRGAPAIGIAAAYGMVLAAVAARDEFTPKLLHAAELLKRQRPTAVNLAWAVDLCVQEIRRLEGQPHAERVERLARLARQLHTDDVAANRAMGKLGAARVGTDALVITHCNAGALATGGYGTALGVVRALHEQGKRVRVLADETRPRLQGARLTAWELAQDGIPVEVIVDGSAASVMARERVDLVVVGADRVAANGDVANKIGTYGLACCARYHQVPFMVVAPWSTVDLACARGNDIPIETRGDQEITEVDGVRLCPKGVAVRNPAFDVTPASLIDALVTERGVVTNPFGAGLSALAR